MKRLIAPTLVAIIVFVSGLAITSNDGSEDKVTTESTPTTSSSAATSSTTSTTEDPSTTTTAPDDDSDGCTGPLKVLCDPSEPDDDADDPPICDDDASFWERQTCTPEDPDPPTDEPECVIIDGKEYCSDPGDPPSGDPGEPDDDVVLNLQSCHVDLDNIDYGFYHRGKTAVENFREPFKGNINTEEGQREFLQGLVDLGCVDPSAMASYARYVGIIPKQSDDATVNRLANAYTTDTKRWQRHVSLFAKRLNGAVMVRVVSNTDPTASTDGQRHIGGKRPPEVFKEPLKGSCPVIVEVWLNGVVYSFCPKCFQPVRRTPEAPPAKSVPSCNCPKPKPPPKPKCKHGCTTTTTRPRGTTTTTTRPHSTTTTTRPRGTTTTTRPRGTTTTTRPRGTTTTTRPVVRCPEGPDKGKPAPGGDISKCRKSTPGEGTPGD